ncbi:Protein CBG07171 [Caenorhabditis briggsae]|uniref:histone acetyltransferase n=1 Tax=Caenorhabditis briggsae TaxID=6238 RepID=A8X3J8_CAEBR|nr:Protein CBG07171 [Caenorhabditis briggsae]CAP27208.2 Protein CBG07171 [Caenorhabditis briggsae]
MTLKIIIFEIVDSKNLELQSQYAKKEQIFQASTQHSPAISCPRDHMSPMTGIQNFLGSFISGNVQNEESSSTSSPDIENATGEFSEIRKDKNETPENYTLVIKEQKKRGHEDLEKEETHGIRYEKLKKAKRQEPQFMCCSENPDLTYSNFNHQCTSGAPDCRIRPNDIYWVPRKQQGEFQEAVCTTCFKEMGNKDGWKQEKNINDRIEEVFKCQECSGLWHQCCSFFYGEPEQFLCRTCAPEAFKLMLDASGSSPDSNFIEERINGFLEEALEEDQEFQKISVRTFYSADDSVKTGDLAPPSWKSKFIAKYGTVIKFASRAIHVFQRQNNVDQIVFSIFASEYRNLRKTWMVIDCLDSIKMFEPVSLRTKVYQELVLIYFDLARNIGLSHSYLWADPPIQGDNYIFPVKPANQPSPTPTMLENWYLTVMEKGKSNGIVKEFRSFAEEKELKKFKKPTEIPIFHNSLWSSLMAVYDVVGKPQKLWKSLSAEWESHGSDNWFIEFNEVEKDEQSEGMCQERLHEILLKKEELQYHCMENSWQFGNPRRARYASVGLINLM